MGNTIIRFDNKSLVISKEDFEIFSKENYYIDDGTTHLFYEKEMCLLIIGADKKPKIAIFFSQIYLEGKEMYEICKINHCYSNKVNQYNLDEIRKDVFLCIKEAFSLLDNILQKRANGVNSISTLGYRYCICDKQKNIHNTYIALKGRYNYLQFLPELDYAFALTE